MYNEEDYISNLFKDNEHLLEEKPSRRAWAKLEDKLDQDKARSSRRIYRYISTAAAVIAIVAMIAAVALFKNGNGLVADNQPVAMNEQQQGELSMTKEGSDWRKEYAPESLEEDEELVTESVENAESMEAEGTQIGEERIVADNFSYKKEEQRVKPSVQPNLEPTAKPKMKKTSPATKPTVITKPQQIPVTTDAAVSDSPPIAEAEIVEEYVVPNAASNMSDDVAYEEIRKRAEREAKMDKAKARASKKEYETAKSKANQNFSDDAKVKDKKTSITDFQWLTGAWSNTTTDGLSYEKWTKTGENTLEAKGYLIQNGDTTFIESMQIKEIRNKVYYVSNFGTDKSSTKFELTSYNNGVAVFENKKSKSPTKVIITENGNNGFTITFQEAITPKLQYRNNIENARASRRMSRAY